MDPNNREVGHDLLTYFTGTSYSQLSGTNEFPIICDDSGRAKTLEEGEL